MVARWTRRALLSGLGTVALAGCSAGPEADSDGASATATATPTESATPTATAAPLPDDCPRSPGVEGLPDRPDDPDADSMTEFVAEYERTLAVGRNPDYADINYLEHVSTERADGGFRVYFFVEPLLRTPTPATSDEGDATPTPTSTGTYNVGYFVDARRVVRDKCPSAITYRFSPYDGFDPRAGGDVVQC
jgi:hypothetical protein